MFPNELMHAVAGPLTAGTGCGTTVMANGGDAAPVPQILEPDTAIFPDKAAPEKLTVIEFELAPDAIVAPAGNVHK